MLSFKKYHYCTIESNNEHYTIYWTRGKEVLSYLITAELAQKVACSEKDELEVMFYAEHGYWGSPEELRTFNKTDCLVHIGNGFVIYEEGEQFEISFEGKIFQINQELKNKALQSDKDAYEVMIYAQTGLWPTTNQDEADRQFIRNFPEVLLKNPDRAKRLFTDKEYQELLDRII